MEAYNEQVLADRRHIGELVRGAALRLWNVQVSDKSRITEPNKFWPMAWDEAAPTAKEIDNIRAMSDNERDAMAAEFLKRVNNGQR